MAAGQTGADGTFLERRTVLLSLRHLIDRARHPRTRADDLAKLRARLAVQPSRREVTPEVIALAEELRSLRREMADALGEVRACHGCAKGHPAPAGRWEGGHCCGGDTFRVFTGDEVAALKWAGTSAADLRPPAGDQAGCAFRGPTGCSLAPEHRPTICLRYVCMELRAELRSDPRWRRISELNRALDQGFRALIAAHDGTPADVFHLAPREPLESDG